MPFEVEMLLTPVFNGLGIDRFRNVDSPAGMRIGDALRNFGRWNRLRFQ